MEDSKKWAIVTGASSGIGSEFAKILAQKGYSLILFARRLDRLRDLQGDLRSGPSKGIDIKIMSMDIRNTSDIARLIGETSGLDVEVVINNAGFGDLGDFDQTDIEKEMAMIDTNIKGLHMMTKEYLKVFLEKDKGYILNVSSSAGLMPAGPYMATYYATKAYVTSLTSAIAGELRAKNSKVYIGQLCPGPVDTEFNDVANCSFSLKGIPAKYCAKYAIESMFKYKEVIVPTSKMKSAVFFSKFLPRKIIVDICGRQQKKKNGSPTD